jgi:hypothetical protein
MPCGLLPWTVAETGAGADAARVLRLVTLRVFGRVAGAARVEEDELVVPEL